jgi:hypothetical protein
MSQFYDTKYKVGDRVEMFSATTGASVDIVGVLERDYIIDEYPDVMIDGKCYDMCDEGDTYYLKKVLTAIFILFCLNGFTQTWPSAGCDDRPYIQGNSDRIYHTANCGVTITSFIIDTATIRFGGYTEVEVWQYFPGLEHTTSGKIKCPICGKWSSKEHIDGLVYDGSIIKDHGKWRLATDKERIKIQSRFNKPYLIK